MYLVYIALLLCFIWLVLFLDNARKRRLPPGPKGLPFVGYLPWLDAKAPHKSLTELARKYGPICGLPMGSVYTVLLSDPGLVRQAFAKGICSGRAPLYLTHGIMKGYGLVCAEGERWKEQRRFVAGCLKQLGMLKFPDARRDTMETRIRESAQEVVKKIEEQSKLKDAINLHDILHHCTGNLINSLVFGKKYDENDEVWKWLQHIQEEGVKHIGVTGVLNFLPFLRIIPRLGNTMKCLIDGKEKTHVIYQQIYQGHLENPGELKSFMAAFAKEVIRRNSISEDLGFYTNEQCFHLMADLFGAGVDTTLTTLNWFFLFMAAYPEEQVKVQEEMDRILGNKEPTLEDRPALRRLAAAIAETQRYRSVVPVGIPHGTLEDTQIGGYTIPKGSMVVHLQWAMHFDPSFWSEPELFKPGRFISEDGNLTKPQAFMPFQVGNRMCVGEELARMILFIFCAHVLQKFTLSAPSDKPLDLEGECGITLVPKPYKLLFKSRK